MGAGPVGGWVRRFREGGLDVIGRGQFGARERRHEQRVMGERIDPTRQPAGRLIDRFFSGRIEERDLGAGETQPMRE